MPPRPERDVLKIPRGFRSEEAGSFVAQLDELTDRMRSDTRDLGRAELEWQPAPGMNTIGMLLAHIAIVEVWWIENAVRGVGGPEVEFQRLLGIGRDDDGMPMPPRGKPPAVLRGKTLSFYWGRIERGRRNLRAAVRALSPRDLDRVRRRLRRDGKTHVYNVRWVLYHLVEHLAGHYGQILLLRHARRARVGIR